ncbi:MAG: transketolase family protein [Euryarchaeota archaeon]|nr:transketolase family protein [Euryarchaeota archaeon]MDE1837230.1 transketolase family protein [Euryarchaeota archaeon]MDE1879841.1 transketolase family protein [Euryarchaeota archaeon]MDE2045166.1 transketolase family protein [Thermoplasmata archaeon]
MAALVPPTPATTPPPAAAPARRTESLRDAYGKTLVELGKEDPTMAVLDADLSGSTRTALFGKQFPDRYFNVGVAEQNMMGIAAGLATGGRCVFASTFAVFAAGLAYNTVRQSLGYNRLNVKVVATHGGLTVGGDGGTHQMLEDVALMRSIPGMSVVVPADAPETAAATRTFHASYGPAYMRLSRESFPVVTDGKFQLGHFGVLRDGKDLTYAANGIMVGRALDAADEMAKSGVDVRVVNCSSMKPFDNHTILRAAQETGAILTMEEHTVLTGLGAAVATATSERYPVPVRRIGTPDLFGESGDPWKLMEKYGLSQERILAESFEMLKLRGTKGREGA